MTAEAAAPTRERQGAMPLVGLLPLAPREGAIGGAPPPLLQTGDATHRTFLARAAGLLRGCGVERLVALVPDTLGPLAAAARREGAELVEVAGRQTRAEVVATGLEHLDPGPAGLPDGLRVLVLPPVLATLAPETLHRFVAGADSPGDAEVRGWVAVAGSPAAKEPPAGAAEGAGRRDSPLAPPVDAPVAAPLASRPSLLLFALPPGSRPLLPAAFHPVGVEDAGVERPIDTLTLYRRHFPQAARGRFHKW